MFVLSILLHFPMKSAFFSLFSYLERFFESNRRNSSHIQAAREILSVGLAVNGGERDDKESSQRPDTVRHFRVQGRQKQKKSKKGRNVWDVEVQIIIFWMYFYRAERQERSQE